MRKHHTGWIAVAGATAVCLAGLGAAGTAAADTTSTVAPQEGIGIERLTSNYTLDGFVIGHLPRGVERYGIHARATTGADGDRVSHIAWMEGAGTVRARVEIIRDRDIATLDDLRAERFAHLAAGRLQRVDNSGRPAFRSAATGEVFWVEEPGVAVAALLDPAKWDAGELARFAGAIRPQSRIGDLIPGPGGIQTPGQQPGAPDAHPGLLTQGEDPVVRTPGEGAEGQATGDAPAAQGTAEAPREQAEEAPAADGAGEPVVHPVTEGEGAERPAAAPEEAAAGDAAPARSAIIPAAEVRACLVGEVAPQEMTREAAFAGPEGAARSITVWRDASARERDTAVDACARELVVGSDQVDALITGLEQQLLGLVRGPEDAAERPAAAEAPQGSAAEQERPRGLLDLLSLRDLV
jgi:hypothetical protein